jgi:arylsulfatase A-like enzyme
MRALIPLALVLSISSCRGPGGQETTEPGSLVTAPAPRPNVIILLADDMGYADCGFTGSTDIRTPNIDRLARAGMVFTDAHVTASVCAPSRAGLLTGRYQQETGFECNLGASGGLLAGQTTLASGLTEAGYDTWALGKWHLGSTPELHPMAMGFDQFTGLIGGSRSYFPILDKEPSKNQRIERNGAPVPESDFDYFTDFLSSEAVQKIESQPEDAPLFLYLSYTAPHSPNHARPDLFESYAHIEHNGRRKYASMVTAMDEGIGRVLDALEAKQQLENTLIFFLSDNGGATTNSSDNGSWRGMKGSKWEGGHRVPLIMHWPATIPPGTHNGLTSSLDLLPTIWTAAGVQLEDQSRLGNNSLDGVDLAQLDWTESQEDLHPKLFWRRAIAAAVRIGDWKLIRVQESDGTFQDPILVNLATDPGEQQNQATTHPTQTSYLLEQLETWEQSLQEPRWLTAQIWRENQRNKHRPNIKTREQERSLP